MKLNPVHWLLIAGILVLGACYLGMCGKKLPGMPTGWGTNNPLRFRPGMSPGVDVAYGGEV